MYSYKESVKKDIREWMDNNRDLWVSENDEDRAYEIISDAIWMADSVTGNASGSYTFNRWQARQYFFEDKTTDDYIEQMINDGFITSESIGSSIALSNWEEIDVCIRCWLCSECLYDILDGIYKD